MSALQKAALSLLITVLLFGGFMALAFTGMFDFIEARFYNPTIAASITREVTQNTRTIEEFLAEKKVIFSGTLEEPVVQRSFLVNQTPEDIFERSRIYGHLLESIGGFQWVRFIGSDGVRVHFSTYPADILAQDVYFVTYRNFDDPSIPFHTIAASAGGMPKFILDGERDRILFSLPLYDYLSIFQGTALFSLSVRALSDAFIREGRLTIGHDISIVSNPPGFLSGVSSANK